MSHCGKVIQRWVDSQVGSPQLTFLVLPRLAFISGQIALIFQNRFLFTSIFRNFATLWQKESLQRLETFSAWK